MQSPRQRYKSIHPNYFSDTKIEEVTSLDRSLLEYHLASLTSRSQEMDFERFARRLCEKEICPNLLPTTGPTGGGDSKADSETYPVSDRLALAWYTGIGNEAAGERWAFAFSAKAKWKAKVEADVEKIVATGRGYGKAFFVSNQSIKASTRSAVEDELQDRFGIDVRILDRNWILTRVFEGRHEQIAIAELRVSGLTDRSPRLGPTDSGRAEEFQRLEARIAEALAEQSPPITVADDALAAAGLSRSLERPRAEVEGMYARADRLAVKYGHLRQRVESAYQWAWTLFWWFEDLDKLTIQYGLVENRAKGSSNIYELERLSNLWTVANTHIHSGGHISKLGDWLEERYQVLTAELKRLKAERDRPSTALQAEQKLLLLELLHGLPRGAQSAHVFDGLREIVERSEGLVGFPLDPIVRIISEMGKVMEDEPAYDRLYETIIEVSARRDGESRAARMLLERGEHLMGQGRYSKAIAMTGQALSRLYKHETRQDEVHALFLCGSAYERIGLPWAARATFLFGASVAVNDYWTYGDLTRGFAACVRRMKIQELRLGRVPQFLAWHELDLAVRARLVAHGDTLPSPDEDEQGYDVLLSRLLMRTDPGELDALRGLPDVLSGLDLHLSSAALLYLLGDVMPLLEMGKEIGKDVSEMAQALWAMNAEVTLPTRPWYGEDIAEMSANVLGCAVSLRCDSDPFLVQVGEWILAALEALLATSAIKRAYAHEPSLTVDLKFVSDLQDALSLKEQDILGRPNFVVECRLLDPAGISKDDQEKMSEVVWRVAMSIVARTVMFNNLESDLGALIGEEKAMERAVSFTSPFSALGNVMGNDPKMRISDWSRLEATAYPNVRAEPWTPAMQSVETETKKLKWGEPDKEPPVGLADPDRISHEDIRTIYLYDCHCGTRQDGRERPSCGCLAIPSRPRLALYSVMKRPRVRSLPLGGLILAK
ncbi:hypothetical protein EON81_04065 [bacterium]|nr:MAG: hypothetical protein EON81_04065 [bacterium]